jgi:hypothetical protein
MNQVSDKIVYLVIVDVNCFDDLQEFKNKKRHTYLFDEGTRHIKNPIRTKDLSFKWNNKRKKTK